jgi:hypothetical protein
MSIAIRKRQSPGPRTDRRIGWLSLAASPTFAVMTGVAMHQGSQISLCSAVPGVLPIDGMAWMYLLMSVFHLPPWLRLGTGLLQREARKPHPIEGD